MITSIPASDVFDIAHLLLEKLGLAEDYKLEDLGVEFGVRVKHRDHGDNEYVGTFVHLDLRNKSAGERVFAHYEIPIDYRCPDGTAIDLWEARRKN